MNTASPMATPNINETERLLSLVGGGVLALYALRRAPLALLAAGVAAGLLLRGTTAHCMLYEALGISTVNQPNRQQAELHAADRMIDNAMEETFPASDPPGWHTGSSFTQVSE